METVVKPFPTRSKDVEATYALVNPCTGEEKVIRFSESSDDLTPAELNNNFVNWMDDLLLCQNEWVIVDSFLRPINRKEN